MPEHIHTLLSIPPKYSAAKTVDFLNGKSTVRIHGELIKHRQMMRCISGQSVTA